jgi:hypothetical protein
MKGLCTLLWLAHACLFACVLRMSLLHAASCLQDSSCVVLAWVRMHGLFSTDGLTSICVYTSQGICTKHWGVQRVAELACVAAAHSLVQPVLYNLARMLAHSFCHMRCPVASVVTTLRVIWLVEWRGCVCCRVRVRAQHQPSVMSTCWMSQQGRADELSHTSIVET